MGEVLIENLTKKYGNVIAVDDLSLEVKDKTFLILLGPSGCGKTTTLRAVAGLETPDSGDIYIDGERVTDVPPQDRDVAMVFQSYALYPHMSVYDNIGFPLKISKTPKEEIGEHVHEAAKILRIEKLLDRYPKQLSGGEQQRVALGAAIVRKPKLFLMDEPLSNIDALLRAHMRVELQRLHRKLRTTTIYVTHDQIEAMTLSHELAVMNKGKLLQIGPPTKIYEEPADTFIAGFIGSPSMNIIEGKINKKKDAASIDFGSFVYSLPNGLKDLIVKRSKTSKIKLGIRPEDVKIINKKKPNNIKAKIDVIENVGRNFYVYLDAGGIPITKIAGPGEKLNVGQEVWLEFDTSQLHFFDEENKRIAHLK